MPDFQSNFSTTNISLLLNEECELRWGWGCLVRGNFGPRVGLFGGCLVGLLCLFVCGQVLLLCRRADTLRSPRGSLREPGGPTELKFVQRGGGYLHDGVVCIVGTGIIKACGRGVDVFPRSIVFDMYSRRSSSEISPLLDTPIVVA